MSLRHEGLASSLMTYGEIYDGIYASGNPQKRGRIPATAAAGEVLPRTRTIMRRFARIHGQLRRQGQIIGDADILIAATALLHDLTLVTRNHRHDQRILDLSIHAED